MHFTHLASKMELSSRGSEFLKLNKRGEIRLDTPKNYNKKFKTSRKKLKMSQEELARETGVSQQTISRIERGGPPTIQAALLLADRLHTTVEELFGDIFFEN